MERKGLTHYVNHSLLRCLNSHFGRVSIVEFVSLKAWPATLPVSPNTVPRYLQVSL